MCKKRQSPNETVLGWIARQFFIAKSGNKSQTLIKLMEHLLFEIAQLKCSPFLLFFGNAQNL